MSVTEPRIIAILDAMVTALEPMRAQAPAPTTVRYLRVLKRYMGEKFTVDEFSSQGGAGRTPGVFVRFDGERPFRGTVGGRRKRVEAHVGVVAVSDNRRDRDSRSIVLDTLADARRRLLGRSFGLDISSLVYASEKVVVENDNLYAYAHVYMTRYSVNPTIDAGGALMLEADGQIVGTPLDNGPSSPPAPSLAVNGVAGTSRYSYDVQYLDASGVYSPWSPWSSTNAGSAVLTGVNSITASWSAVAGATQYRLRRRWAPAGVTTGIIYTGALLTFIDTGAIVANGIVEPSRGVTYDGDF